MSAVDDLFWRGEILQAMFWMRGEGLGLVVAAERLAEFLVAEPSIVRVQMDVLVEDGYLSPSDAGYALTTHGIVEGARSFHDEFASLTRPAHYECGPGCWCQDPDHVGEPCPNQPEPHEHPQPEPPAPDEVPHAA